MRLDRVPVHSVRVILCPLKWTGLSSVSSVFSICLSLRAIVTLTVRFSFCLSVFLRLTSLNCSEFMTQSILTTLINSLGIQTDPKVIAV